MRTSNTRRQSAHRELSELDAVALRAVEGFGAYYFWQPANYPLTPSLSILAVEGEFRSGLRDLLDSVEPR